MSDHHVAEPDDLYSSGILSGFDGRFNPVLSLGRVLFDEKTAQVTADGLVGSFRADPVAGRIDRKADFAASHQRLDHILRFWRKVGHAKCRIRWGVNGTAPAESDDQSRPQQRRM